MHKRKGDCDMIGCPICSDVTLAKSKDSSKPTSDQKPLSENIGRYEAGEYLVTVGIWRTSIEGRLYDTFEIGIRHKATDKFTLLQSDKYNHQSVQEVANAIAHLIGMPAISGEHYTPEWCQEFFT